MLMLVSAIPAVAQTRSILDTAGRRVDVPADPQRIVCIGPGALRLIVYLEAQNRVVGVEEMEKANPGGRPYWLAHPELAKLPRIGPGGPGRHQQETGYGGGPDGKTGRHLHYLYG